MYSLKHLEPKFSVAKIRLNAMFLHNFIIFNYILIYFLITFYIFMICSKIKHLPDKIHLKSTKEAIHAV